MLEDNVKNAETKYKEFKKKIETTNLDKKAIRPREQS